MKQAIIGAMEKDADVPGTLDFEVDGVLDLHTFRPGEVKELLADYFDVCREKGLAQIRIIHGKGTGQLRRTALKILERMDGVKSFRTAGEDAGGWGATLVELVLTVPGRMDEE